MIPIKLGDAARVARKAAGLTQVELAKRARLSSASRYNFFEAGYGNLTSEELDRVIGVLNRAEKKRLGPLSSLPCAGPPPDARKAYRVGASLTQQELGLRMEVPQSLISDFERGKADLTPEHARRWYTVIECATDEANAVSLTGQSRRCFSVVSQIATRERHRQVRPAAREVMSSPGSADQEESARCRTTDRGSEGVVRRRCYEVVDELS